MIANLSKGGGFRGALDYLARTGKDEPPGEVIGGNMATSDPRGLAKEFGASRALRPDVKKPVFHASLALPPGVSLSDQDWNKAAGKFLEEMGLGEDHQHIVIKHVDRDHEHVHVLASRISIRDGSLARERRADYKQAHGAAAAAAAAVGLKPVEAAPKHERKATLTRAELAHAERAGQPHPKLQIAARLDAALALSKNLDEFKAVAADHGVDVKFSSNAGGIYGVSYRLTNPQPGGSAGFVAEWMKGSQISKAHTLPSITRRLAGELDTPGAARGPRVRADILDRLAREKRGDVDVVRWQNGAIAAVATDSEIRWRTGSAAESKVAAALAVERGWKEIDLADRGNQQKNQAAIDAYTQAGIKVNLNGKTYKAQAHHGGNDARSEAAGRGRDAAAAQPVATDRSAPGPAASPDQHPAKPNQPSAAAVPAAGAAAVAGNAAAGGAARAADENRPVAHASKQADPKGEKNVDALDFLNDSPPAMAPAVAPKLAGPQPTAEDHNKAAAAALAREMARRRWARAEAVQIELAGQREALAWLDAQSLTRRTLARATGERARLVGEIEALEAAHKQAQAREAALLKALQADPIAASLIQEEAQGAAQQRADQKADAAKILADREAAAEAKREQALAREREAEQDKDEPRPRKKAGGPAAPKPR